MEGALSDVRVLDLTRFLAGPHASMVMADLGAEVIKIEEPGQGDYARAMPPHFFQGESAYFLAFNRGKRSIALNLKSEAGREIFYGLVRVSDVVFDNFRPGVLEKLGLGYETLREINPRIISCSVTAFGPDGPYRDKPGFDLIVQAMGGAMSLTGERGAPPYRIGIPIGDLAGSVFAVQGILAALHARDRTNRGQKVNISLLDCQVALLSYQVTYHHLTGKDPEPVGSGHSTAVPIGAYRTADQYIVLDAFVQHFFAKLSAVIGRPELPGDPRFIDPGARLANRAALDEILDAAFRQKPAAEWLAALEEAGVPAGPINTVGRVLADPDVLGQQMVASVPHARGGEFKAAGNPIKLSGTPGGSPLPPPLLGQHTAEVLGELLGYDAARIAGLAGSGAIALGPEQ